MSASFAAAQPVWVKGRIDTWNQMAGLHASWQADDTSTETALRITGADSYRIWVNGEHAGFGPARTAHGYARVDEWPLNRWMRTGENHVAVEVHYHGVDSYVYALQSPFVQAELLVEDSVVAATPEGFAARVLPERVQKVERYSKQRPFAEAYHLSPDCHAWRTGQAAAETAPLETQPELTLLPRNVLLPEFDRISPKTVIATGAADTRESPPPLAPSAARDGAGKRVAGYTIDEFELDISTESNRLDFKEDDCSLNPDSLTIPAHSHVLYDFETVQCGFIGIDLCCEATTRVLLIYDEVRGRNFALGVGAIVLDLEPGTHNFESIAPYSLRFLRVVSVESTVTVGSIYVRDFAYPKSEEESYTGNDDTLAAIFNAARQTFRTNSIDLFTDCPSRERGGYPCDAWFTARSERLLTGESRVERNFLENYFLPEQFSGIPDGMIPHCYPSDRLGNGAFIPNWAIWLLLQLVDYCERTSDTAMRDLARPRVDALITWFTPHLNDEGLLEDLPGWVFVEWSPANNYTEGVNHPTNMLYAHCLEQLSRLYDQPQWAEQGARIREAVLQESWDGRWFADQSLRVEGKLQRTAGRTEACQYHALWTELTNDHTEDLWLHLRDNWGPSRGIRMVPESGMSTWKLIYEDGVEPRPDDTDLAPAELLYGLLLRLDLLHRHGNHEQMLAEVKRIFGQQAELTGTLWEHVTPFSSCNHGFASCACDYIHAATR